MQVLDVDCNLLPGIEKMKFRDDELYAALDLPKDSLESLKGQRVRLRITLRNADLYTFTL